MNEIYKIYKNLYFNEKSTTLFRFQIKSVFVERFVLFYTKQISINNEVNEVHCRFICLRHIFFINITFLNKVNATYIFLEKHLKYFYMQSVIYVISE